MNLLLRAATRVLRFFPALLLAFVIVAGCLAVREFIAESADQFFAVQLAGQ